MSYDKTNIYIYIYIYIYPVSPMDKIVNCINFSIPNWIPPNYLSRNASF